ncbi:MAG: acyl-CoA synthetase [Rhodospirillales bacterium]
MLTPADSYEDVCRLMRWRVPAVYNMGVDVCDKHADARPEALALIVEDENGAVTRYTFGTLRRLSDRLANVLRGSGVLPGERIGILLSQSVEAAIAHVAAWKAGCISIPLFTLFGEDALEFRLADSAARLVVTDTANLGKLEAIRDRLPELRRLLVVGAGCDGAGLVDFWPAIERASDTFAPMPTRAEDPALIIYTSGTTGNPKGALHAHRSLLGHLPAVEFFNEFLPQPGDLMWTPAEWAWIGGLMNVLMSSWHHGVPVLAQRARKFDPERALALIARHRVRNTFMPPTALRLIREVEAPRERFAVDLRTLTCAGEPMGAELLDWCRSALSVTPNEYYGQTECNLVVANCARIMPVRPGSMGRPVPGHVVEIIDDAGNPLPPDTIGRIAVRRPDPVMMLEYWRQSRATTAKFVGDWLVMGDLGRKDADGYLWFLGRDDDVITSAGYRIGPGEIEDCLGRHPAVSLAAVVGVPDALRTEAVKAFIVLRAGHAAGTALEEDIRAFVKTRLSPHEYPRLIEFVDSLPMTATGKIRRGELRRRAVAERAS